jgi:hypothetical protein
MDASIGRFLSPDPYLTEPGNTQNFNRYSYVVNNPLSYIDPTGFAGCTPDPTAIANICGHKPTPNSAPYAPHTDSWSEYCFYLSYAGFYSPMCDPPSSGGGYWYATPATPAILPATVPELGKTTCPNSIAATCNKPKQVPKPPCQGSKSFAGRWAGRLDKFSTWSGRTAIGSGAAALVTSETVVPAAIFGVVAAVSEVGSQVSAAGSGALKLADGNYQGAQATFTGSLVGNLLPAALFKLHTPAEKEFGKLVADTEAEAASDIAEMATCPE